MLATVEKRDHIRMAIESEAEYREANGTEIYACTVRELSATGMSLSTDSKVEEGILLNIKITPLRDITPPFNAVVETIRCSSNDERYDIACKIVEIIDDAKIEGSFP